MKLITQLLIIFLAWIRCIMYTKIHKYNYKADFGNNYKYVFVNTPFLNLALFSLHFKIKNLQILCKERR